MKNVHVETIDNLYKEYESSTNGLTPAQVEINRRNYGINKLQEKKPKKWYHFFIEQYKDLLMITLLVASLVSLIVSAFPQHGYQWGQMLTTIEGWENFILIVVITVINAILGMIQALKAQKSLESLKKLSSPKAKVIRGNQSLVVNSEDLVVGDIVIVEAGDIAPADGRIIDCFSLKVNESSLTGEATVVLKNNNPLDDPHLGIGDRLNCIYSGCLVVYGRAKFIVTAVGSNTEIGKISTLLNETKTKKTPLQVNLDRLAKFLVYIILAVCLVLFVVNMIKMKDPSLNKWETFGDSINFSIALAVAVIPEALSSIVTIVLSISTKRLAKQNAIVKELKAVEGLGSVSIICSDKTGTLTQNKMTVIDLYTDETLINQDMQFNYQTNKINLPELAVLCSDAKVVNNTIIGDPTESCLIDYYNKHSDSEQLRSSCKRISELPFDSERMMMSTLVQYQNKKFMITKGAIDQVLSKITHIYLNGEVRKINDNDITKINTINRQFASEGKRVLCFAFKEMQQDKLQFNDESNLIFIGLISMIDPPRVETIQAIKECKVAGIRPIMITGDHPETAVAIAKQIGIFNEGDLSLSGRELKEISEEELTLNIAKYSVYARVSPEDKIKIVRAWQKHNMIVSMTGDGVNDAPSLKEANIGVAMGITGTEVSKDAASMILTDDNFATIITAIKSGRNVYNNIKSAIKFLLTGSLATILATAVLLIFSLIIGINYVPFNTIQLLFLNLVTDSWPAIALGLESYKNDVIYEKPRKANEFFITPKFMKHVVLDALLISGVVIVSFFFTYYTKVSGIVINDTDQLFDQASGIAFLTLAFCRLFHSFNCRMNKPVLFSKEFFSNQWIFGSFLISAVLLLIVYYVPGVNSVFMHSSPWIRDKEITPYFKDYGVWVAFGFASFVLWIYQFVALIKVSIQKQVVSHNKRQLIAKFINDDLNKNAYRIIQVLASSSALSLTEIDNAMNKQNNLFDLNTLVSYEYVIAYQKDNHMVYQLNPSLSATVLNYNIESNAI